MAISDAFLQELRSRVDMEQLVSPYVSGLRRRGRTLTGLCPFHNEKTPSFTVYTENQSFYCFGCGAGGDAVTFVRRAENLDYVEAVKQLAQQVGMRMPEDGFDDTLMKRRMEILSANREAARFFHEQLYAPAGREAAQYLERRALHPNTVRHFGLGFAPNNWGSLTDALKQKGFSEQLLLEANLVRRSEKGNVYDNFRNRLMFPIIDIRGNVIGFGGRVLDDSKPKYINTSDTMVYKKSHGVFALNFAKNANDGRLIVAEGYMDVIALHQAGFTNAVACLGTALTREQANLLSRCAKEVLLAYDTDEAGQKATRRAIDIFSGTSLSVRVLRMTGGKDPDEIIQKHGKERFQNIIDGAANDIEYRLLREREKYDLDSDDGKMKFLRAAAQILAQLSGDIEREVYAVRLSQELSVDKDAILREAMYRRGQLKKEREKDRARAELRELQFPALPQEQSALPLAARRAEETILASLLRNPDYDKALGAALEESVFFTDFYRRFYAVLAQRIAQNLELEPTFFAQDFNPEEMSRIMRLFAQGAEIKNTVKECRDCIETLRKARQAQESVPLDVGKLSDEEFLKIFPK